MQHLTIHWLEDAWQGTELDSVIAEKMREIEDGSMLAQALKEYAGKDKYTFDGRKYFCVEFTNKMREL